MQCGGSSNEDGKIAERRDLRAALRTLNPAARTQASIRIHHQLTDAHPPTPALVVAGFMPLPDEPDITRYFISVQDAGGTVAIPRLLSPGHMEFRQLPPSALTASATDAAATALRPGPHHILEPDPDRCLEIPSGTFTLILVPGLGFAPGGHRLGRGAGYYDRWLAAITGPRPPTIGLAFACQIRSSLPTHPHDQTVDAILTDTGWVPGARPPSPCPAAALPLPPRPKA